MFSLRSSAVDSSLGIVYLVEVGIRCIIIALALLLLDHQKCAAQSDTVQQGLTVSHRTYNALDGLSGNCVFAIEKDASGFMWFATSKGLDRFDGNRFKSAGQQSLY